MSGKRTLIFLAAVGLSGLIYLGIKLLPGPTVTEEQRLAALVDRVAAAAENHDIKTVRSAISKAYRDDEGRDYGALNQVLTFYLLRRRTIGVFLLRKAVTVDRDATPLAADLTVVAVLTRGAKPKTIRDVLPESATAMRFELSLKKEDDDWKVVFAAWKRVRDFRQFLE